MKILYIDASTGISGDKFLAALIDAGADLAAVEDGVRGLDLGISISFENVLRGGISGKLLKPVSPEEKQPHRDIRTIRKLIRDAGLSDVVEKNAVAMFDALGRVESALHGIPVEEIHFHELGAIDSITDIVAGCVALDSIRADRVICSPIALGTGFVNASHGKLPVPAPATAKLLEGCPVFSCGITGELTTPTGAAIAKILVREFGSLPAFRLKRVGHGAGFRDIPGFPNILRAFVGEKVALAGETQVYVLECEIDDMNPEGYTALMEEAFAAGALDVFFTPVYMKRNRPGTLITILSPVERREDLTQKLFSASTTIGVRYYPANRVVLERWEDTVKTPYGEVAVKYVRLPDGALRAKPEYESCAAAGRRSGVSWTAVSAAAVAAIAQKRNPSRR